MVGGYERAPDKSGADIRLRKGTELLSGARDFDLR